MTAAGPRPGPLPAAPFVAGPVPQPPAMPAVLHDDPLQRILLTGSAIKRGNAVFQKYLGVLGDMMESALASSDQDMQCPMQVQLSSAFKWRMGQAASEFRRSVAEFYGAYSCADISGAKGNTFLTLTTNPKFSPYDLSEFTSVQTMESKIMKYLFPEGHKVKNLTRQRDGKQLVLHYIPHIEKATSKTTLKLGLCRQNVSQLWGAVVRQAQWTTCHWAQQLGDIVRRGANKS
jgi:hypothetical protein